MRFAPAAAALSLFLAMSASMGQGAEREVDPRAMVLVAQGKAALAAGDTQKATDSFEAALAVDPAHTPILLDLADAARRDGLQGKAIRYYREALARDPGNIAAISGEGEALAEKGAVEKARASLAKLQSLCGTSCPQAEGLKMAIARGKPARMAAETIVIDTGVVQN